MNKIKIERTFYDKDWEEVQKWEDAQFVLFTAYTHSPEESDAAEKACEKRAKRWAKEHSCSRVKLELRSSDEGGDPYDDAVGYLVER